MRTYLEHTNEESNSGFRKKAMTQLTANNFRIKYLTNFGRNLRKNSK
jgi:hypothetical protein